MMNPHMFIAATYFHKFLALYTTNIHQSPNTKETTDSAFIQDDDAPDVDPMQESMLEYFVLVSTATGANTEL